MANFDTHAAIKLLMKEGIKEKQAEAIIKVVQEGKDNNSVSKVELKAELLELKSEIKTDFTEFQNEMKTEIHQSEKRLMLMMGGAAVAICTIMGAMQYLFRLPM